MEPREFVEKFYLYALQVQGKTDIPAVAIMAQATLESGWGKNAIGNNVFGIKYRKGDPAYRKVLTTEHSKDRNAFRGQDVKSVTLDRERGVFVFKVYQYFADYDNPAQAFESHARLLLNDRYKHALRWKHSPKRYLIAVWRAGYATDIHYGWKICSMVDSVVKRLPDRIPTFRPPEMIPKKAKIL